MTPKQAGLRLILLALPFLAFGLLWALDPPMVEALGQGAGVAQALGVTLALFGIGAIALGLFLLRRGEEKIL